MTEQNDSSVEPVSETVEIMHAEFGLPLKEAREKAGLSISDAAQSLLIPQDIISAIENSQMEKLPSATYTRGYIRGYARILNISADEVIALYNSMIPTAEMSASVFIPSEHQDANNKTAIIIAASVILLLVMAWWFQSEETPKPEETYTYNEISGFNELADSSNREDIVATNSDEILIEPSTDSNTDTAETNQLVEEANITIDDKQAATTDEMILTAIGDSWCEIFDASGKRLFYQLMKEDNEEVLHGLAPFKVFLGNASQIRIEVNGKIVDFESLIVSNKNTANFSVSAESDAFSNN